MMRSLFLKNTLALLLLLSATAFGAADDRIDGDWAWKMPSPFGETTATMTLRTESGKLTGQFAFSETRKLEIRDGSIEGKTIRMTVKRDRPEGGDIVYQMTGSWDGAGEIKGTAEAEMFGQKNTVNWTATRRK